MGMYDHIIVSTRLLPLGRPKFIKDGTHTFQTKDFDCILTTYEIDTTGRLLDCVGTYLEDYTGVVNFYDGNMSAGRGDCIFTTDGSDYEFVEYQATFVDGRLKGRIKKTEHTKEKAMPVAEMNKLMPHHDDGYSKEESLRRRQESLVGKTVYILWGGCNSPKEGYEGKVMAETEEEVCVQSANKLEVIHRCQRDVTMFDSYEDAKRDHERRKKEWKDSQKRFKMALAKRS